MKSFRKNFDFLTVFKYAFIMLIFLIFNNLEREVLPYSSGILTACLVLGSSIFTTSFIYILSFLFLGEVGLLGASGIFVLVLAPITYVYRRFKVKTYVEFLAYTLVGLLGFVFLGSSTKDILMDKRILTVILTTLLCFIAIISGKAISEKGLKYKLGFEEVLSVAIMSAFFGLGICNTFSPFVFKPISIFFILISCYIYRTGIGSVISSVLGISLAIFYTDINYLSIYLVYGIFAQSLIGISKYASALSLLAIDYLLQAFFNIYPAYTSLHFISILLGCVCFCVIPNAFLQQLKDKLFTFREKQLVRSCINRNRTILSNKLYDLSAIFSEMANSFNLFQKKTLSEDGAKSIMEKEILTCVCKECENFNRCKKNERLIGNDISKMIDIGFAKGKLSLIDLPNDISLTCIHPNNVLYGLNKLLADYRARLIENENLAVGRRLIASEALGIADILQGLALESGQLLKYNNKLERLLFDKLLKGGFIVSELLLFGEEDRISVSLILTMKEFSMLSLQNLISNVLGINMIVVDKVSISEEKLYLSFKKANEYDAVFGIAKTTKDGSIASGDTYSMTKISCDKYLVALSDGMGSGKDAQSVSSTSLSLIESFYKAGLNENLILDTVNKLLTINTEDYFTALDISVIDLKTCSADFIKYGAPYGFIISENGIKIIEGSSLPLGIIDGLKPSVASTPLNDGDVILLVTDGISDAFNNSGAIIDYLRTLPAKNPQTLADDLLKYAVDLNNGEIKDDMTALAVRIYKKVS